MPTPSKKPKTTAANKPAVKKTAAKKPATKRSAATKTTAKRASTSKPVAKKAPAKKAPAKRAAARPTQDEIRARAAQIWVEGGKRIGSPVADWVRAEKELYAERGLKL